MGSGKKLKAEPERTRDGPTVVASAPFRYLEIDRVEYVAATSRGDARVIVRAGSAEVEIVVPRREIALLAAYLLEPLKVKSWLIPR